jgi:hypothetical protein
MAANVLSKYVCVCMYVKECLTLTFISKMLHKSERGVVQRAFGNVLDLASSAAV